ncbi:winged helix-turn-helix domain-containing protein [Pseudoalteromonas piscicida]|uniref:winged helix-turn-helix domain-containing protein n=1 Tax=Pseudoalteromonas piscicida TaxID=43662 RepID=UPI0030A1ED39
MRFEIAAIRFDTVNRTLANSTTSIRLEPKPYSLLQTLIAANGNVVSRAQLIEQVWQGRIVTESAINKAVSTLRQHLNKLDAETDYIETIPTLGYRLVPDAVMLETTATPSTPKVLPRLIGAVAITFVAALVVFNLVQPPPSPEPLIPHKLASQSGIELQLSSAPLHNSFSYLHPTTAPISELWLHHQGENQKLLTGNVTAQALNPDTSHIAFIDDENGCTVKQFTVSTGNTQPLFGCQAIEKIKLAWGRDGQELIYRKRDNIHSGFGIYRFDINTQKHTQLTLPPSSGNVRGDHLFSLSHTQERLAVATYLGEEKHRLTLYRYPEMTIKHTIELPYHLTSLTWSADGDTVYFSHANSIYSVNTHAQTATLIHTLTAPIESLALLDSDNTLLFNQYKLTSSIKLFEHRQENFKTMVNNQALNRLPRANQAERIWYISDQGAHSALWSINTQAQAQVPLPHSFHFQRYQLNNDASKILFEYQDAIYQFTVDDQQSIKVIGAELKPYVANYGQHDGEIIYSSERSGSWQLWSLDLITGKHQQLTTQGGYSGYRYNGVLYFTKFTQPGIWQLKNGQQSRLIADVAITNWLNWRLRGHVLYYQKAGSIYQYDLSNHQESLHFTPPAQFIGQFDVLENGDIVFAELNQPSGELWRLSHKN